MATTLYEFIFPISEEVFEDLVAAEGGIGPSKPPLRWYDTLRERADKFFTDLQPGQLVNRIPNANLLCRKTPFIRLIHRMQSCFPKLYNFIPRSFLLPSQSAEFEKALTAASGKRKSWVIKPDCGALGIGITILDPPNTYVSKESYYAVAQEYVKSVVLPSSQGNLPANTKFDFRIYALITFMSPDAAQQKDPVLQVWVYDEGIARFCSETQGKKSDYARLTNTSVNKKNPAVNLNTITQSMKKVLAVFEPSVAKGIKRNIDRAIWLSVVAALPYFSEKPSELKNIEWHIQCFQILGFDVILDENSVPFILEVNFRPSLGCSTKAEAFKKTMLQECRTIIDGCSPGRTTVGGFRRLNVEADDFPARDVIDFSLALGRHYDPNKAVGPLRMPAPPPINGGEHATR